MPVPRCSSISSEVDENWLMQVDNGVSKKDPSKTRRSLLAPFQTKPCGVRHESGKNFYSQNGNASTHFLRSSFLMMFSTFAIMLETDEWLPQARACLRVL